MYAMLVMFRSDGTRRDFSIKPDRKYIIGRKDTADLRIPLASVSREHAVVYFDEDEDELVVEDLGSSNGTFLNGEKIRRADLAPGDVLTVGDVPLQVVIDGHPAEVHPLPAAKLKSSDASSTPSTEIHPPGKSQQAAPTAGHEPAARDKSPKPAKPSKGDSEDDSFLDLIFSDEDSKNKEDEGSREEKN